MRTVSHRLVIAALLLGWVPVASAQTADEVVERHLAALGGRAALGKLTSRSMTGTITLSGQGGSVSGSVEILSQEPNKSRTLTTLDLSARGAGQIVVDQRFDGTSGYVIDSVRGNRDVAGSQLDYMRNGSFPNPYLNYKAMGGTLELSGKEKLGGRDAYVLIFKSKNGTVIRQYIDAESYLPIKSVVKLEDPQVGDIEQTTETLDHRDVDGVKVPFQVRASNAFQSSTIIITKVEHNGKIDETLFSKPVAGKK